MDQKDENNNYWVSLADYEQDPQFMERTSPEFKSSPLREEESDGGFSRREFMKLMAASTALASSACFQKPMHKILPYVNQPEEVTYGVPNYYASTCGECASGCGVLVKTREGRPIKMEGNPDHPMSKGGLCARGQASVLSLYDPDRLRNPVTVIRGSRTTSVVSWDVADKKIAEKLKAIKASGGRVRILSGTINSPTTKRLIGEFLKEFPAGAHVVYDPVSAEEVAEAQALSYGNKLIPRYRFDKADVIVSIDGDFLGNWLSPVEFTKEFTATRKLGKDKKRMSKHIAFDSAMSLTGTNADVRVPMRPEDGARVALALAHELAVTLKAASVDGETAGLLANFSAQKVSGETGIDVRALQNTAKALSKAKGKSLVIAGSAQAQSENGLSLQVAVNLLNSMLQNDGVTVDYAMPSNQSQGSYKELLALVKDMNEGKVEALLIYGSNPAYTLPKEVGFSEASRKVGLVVSFADRVDETAEWADYVCPDNHPLERWGDAEPQSGLYSLVQPTIRPIYDTRAFEDSLLAFNKAGLGNAKLDGYKDFHAYLQNNWRETVYKPNGIISPFENFWETSLRDGVFVTSAARKSAESKPRAFRAAALKENLPVASQSGPYSLAFYEKVSLGDGRMANNAWIQELPDPVSRISWDNYANVAPATAKALNIKECDVLALKVGDADFEMPAHIQPGLHEKVIAIALGYGREAAGTVGTKIGKSMYPYMKVDKAGRPVFSGFAASMTDTGKVYPLASIQEENVLHGRPIIREASFEEWLKNPEAGNEEKEELTTIWSKHEYKGYRWGMAIDLNSCTGCSACVVSCQSENNVPVVGKDGVYRSRIMHWLRIDRYYSGTPDNPKVYHQPMLCQQCENAPCETVCPVIATAHDDEGLNMQVYNRCVGTRYCANNCPYKVRRFNWFDYNYGGQIRYPLTLAQNPEVTVRSRGVMEKCTFCLQRIVDAKNTARDENRRVEDRDLKTACQQSCPGDAISFGDINNADSEVFKTSQDPRGYHVLADLNVRPSITYLTKVRNGEEAT